MRTETENLVRRLKNPRWYIEHFLCIRTKKGKLARLVMKPAQRKLYEVMKREHDAGRPVRIVILKARQLGFSTVTEAVFFHDSATRPLVRTLIAAHREDATANLFKMNKIFYDNLPAALKPMRKNSNAQEIVFENPTKDAAEMERNPGLMSSIRCVTAKGGGIGRSDTLTNVHASEAAFWPQMEETMDALLQAVPDDPDTAVVIESTPNGFNAFKRFWDDAVDGTVAFVPLFFPWFDEPEYRAPVADGTEWTEEELAMKAAYGLDEEQLMWRRNTIAGKLRGDAEKFRQEYPSCAEEAFLMSGDPFFDNAKLLLCLKAAPRVLRRGRYVYAESENLRPEGWTWQEAADGEISIYAEPEERAPYVFGGDTAGDGSDRFTAHGLDNRTGGQTAQLWYDGGSELWYAQQLYCLGMDYNGALLSVEINYSTYPERKLEEWGYPRLYIREKPDDRTRELDTKKFGWRTDQRTRPLILANLHTVADQTADMLASEDLLREMLTFVRNEEMRPEAAPGEHDDLVMAAAIAHWSRAQQSYELLAEEEEKQTKLIDRLDPRHKKHRRTK